MGNGLANALYYGDNLENVCVAMVRDFAHIVDREKAAMGCS